MRDRNTWDRMAWSVKRQPHHHLSVPSLMDVSHQCQGESQPPSLSGELIPHPKALHKKLTLPGHDIHKVLSLSTRPVPIARLPPTTPVYPGLLICTAMPCHWWDFSSAAPGVPHMLLGAFQHRDLCFWRAWSRNPPFSSQVILTSKLQHGEEAHVAAMALLQDMWKRQVAFILEGGFISPWEKEAYFMSCWNMRSRKAPDGL